MSRSTADCTKGGAIGAGTKLPAVRHPGLLPQ